MLAGVLRHRSSLPDCAAVPSAGRISAISPAVLPASTDPQNPENSFQYTTVRSPRAATQAMLSRLGEQRRDFSRASVSNGPDRASLGAADSAHRSFPETQLSLFQKLVPGYATFGIQDKTSLRECGSIRTYRPISENRDSDFVIAWMQSVASGHEGFLGKKSVFRRPIWNRREGQGDISTPKPRTTLGSVLAAPARSYVSCSTVSKRCFLRAEAEVGRKDDLQGLAKLSYTSLLSFASHFSRICWCAGSILPNWTPIPFDRQSATWPRAANVEPR